MKRVIAAVVLAFLTLAGLALRSRAETGDFAILVPDWRNNAVYRISPDGKYEGTFVDAAKFAEKSQERAALASPRGLMLLEGEPARIWIWSERALSEWTPAGRLQKIVFADTSELEDPVCAARVGDEIFIVSGDKHLLLVFRTNGELARTVNYPDLDVAKDCKVAPDGSLWISSSMHAPTAGLISTWDPKNQAGDAQPTGARVMPEGGQDGTISVHSFVFGDNEDVITTDFSRGRLERWSLDGKKKLAVLRDSDTWGTYQDLAKAPDALIYLTGPAGVYRFSARDGADALKELKPFFDGAKIENSYSHPFSPASIAFVPRALLEQNAAQP